MFHPTIGGSPLYPPPILLPSNLYPKNGVPAAAESARRVRSMVVVVDDALPVAPRTPALLSRLHKSRSTSFSFLLLYRHCYLKRAARVERGTFFPGVFTGHDPTRGSCQEVIQISRVEWGRIRECFRYHGSGRVGSGRVGSGREVS